MTIELTEKQYAQLTAVRLAHFQGRIDEWLRIGHPDIWALVPTPEAATLRTWISQLVEWGIQAETDVAKSILFLAIGSTNTKVATDVSNILRADQVQVNSRLQAAEDYLERVMAK